MGENKEKEEIRSCEGLTKSKSNYKATHVHISTYLRACTTIVYMYMYSETSLMQTPLGAGSFVVNKEVSLFQRLSINLAQLFTKTFSDVA